MAPSESEDCAKTRTRLTICSELLANRCCLLVVDTSRLRRSICIPPSWLNGPPMDSPTDPMAPSAAACVRCTTQLLRRGWTCVESAFRRPLLYQISSCRSYPGDICETWEQHNSGFAYLERRCRLLTSFVDGVSGLVCHSF